MKDNVFSTGQFGCKTIEGFVFSRTKNITIRLRVNTIDIKATSFEAGVQISVVSCRRTLLANDSNRLFDSRPD